MRRQVLPFFLLLPLVVATSPEASVVRHHNFVRTSLAAIRLGSGNFIKFDAKEGYYLISHWDGLGRLTQARLLLCPEPKQFGFDLSVRDDLGKLRLQALPRLRSGTGVNIGDTPADVQRKIGGPHGQYLSKAKQRLYVYRAKRAVPLQVEGSRTPRWDYEARYTFRGERLWAIEYLAYDPNVE